MTYWIVLVRVVDDRLISIVRRECGIEVGHGESGEKEKEKGNEGAVAESVSRASPTVLGPWQTETRAGKFPRAVTPRCDADSTRDLGASRHANK